MKKSKSKTQLPGARIFTVDDFIRKSIPPREPILELIVAPKEEKTVMVAGNLVLIAGGTGAGKSQLAMGMALAISTGGRFLHWRAPQPRRVLYVDGEMAAQPVQRRFASMMKTMGIESTRHRLAILSQDWQEPRLPRLDAPAFKSQVGGPSIGQRYIEPLLNQDWTEKDDEIIHSAEEPTLWRQWGGSVVILDNAVSLFDPNAEMEIDVWARVQEWLLSLRQKGVTVILLHHFNRQGENRGLSAREDVLDLIIRLERDDDYRDGAKVGISFPKHRDIYGKAIEPFDAWLHKTSGWNFKLMGAPKANWILSTLERRILEYVQSKPNCTTATVATKSPVKGTQAVIYKTVDRLRDHGLLKRKDGKLSITPSGRYAFKAVTDLVPRECAEPEAEDTEDQD